MDIKFEYYDAKKFQKEFEATNGNYKNIAVVKDCFDVISSYENKYTKGNLQAFGDDLSSTFYDGDDCCVFLMYRDNKPVAFNVFSNTNFDNKVMSMEMIYTHKDYLHRDYASNLMMHSFTELAKKGITDVVSTVNKENDSSIALHEKMKKIIPMESYYEADRLKYDSKISELVNVEELSM